MRAVRDLPQCMPKGVPEGEEAVSVTNMMRYVQRIESAYTQVLASNIPIEQIPSVCQQYLDLRTRIDG